MTIQTPNLLNVDVVFVFPVCAKIPIFCFKGEGEKLQRAMPTAEVLSQRLGMPLMILASETIAGIVYLSSIPTL